MALPKFYYANGTAVTANFFGIAVGPIGGGSNLHVKGVNGEFYSWDGAVANDPFPNLLNTSLWQTARVPYPASAIDMGTSIKQGVDWTVAQIIANPGAFALGGYSQGAAVMSNVYNECRQGRLVDFSATPCANRAGHSKVPADTPERLTFPARPPAPMDAFLSDCKTPKISSTSSACPPKSLPESAIPW